MKTQIKDLHVLKRKPQCQKVYKSNDVHISYNCIFFLLVVCIQIVFK